MVERNDRADPAVRHGVAPVRYECELSTQYREQTEPTERIPTHYSMYKVNLPEGDN